MLQLIGIILFYCWNDCSGDSYSLRLVQKELNGTNLARQVWLVMALADQEMGVNTPEFNVEGF